jgi:hypothetical protein
MEIMNQKIVDGQPFSNSGRIEAQGDHQMKPFLRRKWVYIQEPSAYGVHCEICGGEVCWSEYRGMVFCWRCLRDTRGSGGIFSGPIPMEVAKMLGISFDRIHIASGRILRMETSKSGKRLIWKFERTKNELRNHH